MPVASCCAPGQEQMLLLQCIPRGGRRPPQHTAALRSPPDHSVGEPTVLTAEEVLQNIGKAGQKAGPRHGRGGFHVFSKDRKSVV